MLTRRELLRRTIGTGAAALLPGACGRESSSGGPASEGVWLNDIHSRLNRTRVLRVETPATADALADVVRRAARDGRAISIAGGRHAMGGQQFATDAVHVDTSALNEVVELDSARGQVEVGAGIQWPALVAALVERQQGQPRQWGIVQKQTGADRLSLGGALAANAHGRGLTYAPIAQDVEAFTLVDARGRLLR